MGSLINIRNDVSKILDGECIDDEYCDEETSKKAEKDEKGCAKSIKSDYFYNICQDYDDYN